MGIEKLFKKKGEKMTEEQKKAMIEFSNVLAKQAEEREKVVKSFEEWFNEIRRVEESMKSAGELEKIIKISQEQGASLIKISEEMMERSKAMFSNIGKNQLSVSTVRNIESIGNKDRNETLKEIRDEVIGARHNDSKRYEIGKKNERKGIYISTLRLYIAVISIIVTILIALYIGC